MGVFFARGSRTHGSRVVVTLAIDDNDGDEVSLMPCSKFRGFCLGQLNQQMKVVMRLSFRKQGFSFFLLCGFTRLRRIGINRQKFNGAWS